MSAVAYLLASGQLDDEGEPEMDLMKIQQLMEAVQAKGEAWNTATVELKQSIEVLRDACNLILEGLA